MENIGEIIGNINNNHALYAFIVFCAALFFKKPLEILLNGLIPGQHSSHVAKLLKGIFSFVVLAIIFVSLLQAQKQDIEKVVELEKIKIPLELEKIKLESDELYGLTQKALNSLLNEFKKEKIDIDTDPEEARRITKGLLGDIFKMKADLTHSLGANEGIRKLAIKALISLDSGNLSNFQSLYKKLKREGAFDECPSPDASDYNPPPTSGYNVLDSPDNSTPPVKLAPIKNQDKSYDEGVLKKLHFLLSSYGNWQLVTGDSEIKIYPTISLNSDLMMKNKTYCLSEVKLTDSLDDYGFNYGAYETDKKCVNGALNNFQLEGYNILGVGVDGFIAQYKRIDVISSEVYGDVVFKGLNIDAINDPNKDAEVWAERLRYINEWENSDEQLKLLGELYFVKGLTQNEIEDIPFPNPQVVSDLKLKLETVQSQMLSDPRTQSHERVFDPIIFTRIGYEKKYSTPRPKPPSIISIN